MSAAASRVPWVVGWTSEERFEFRPCRWAKGKLSVWQPHSPGIGRPVFARPHQVRQRRSIAELRCSICGEKTLADDRWWFGLGEFVGELWMTSESPIHKRCADYALVACPHLKGRDNDLCRMPGGYEIAASVVGGDAFEHDFGISAGNRIVIGSLKFAWPKLIIAGARRSFPRIKVMAHTKMSSPALLAQNERMEGTE